MRQKGFAPIIILVLILLGVIGYFIYKNMQPRKQTSLPPSTPIATSEPIENWETFTSQNLKVSFRYPSFFRIIETVAQPSPLGYMILGEIDLKKFSTTLTNPTRKQILIMTITKTEADYFLRIKVGETFVDPNLNQGFTTLFYRFPDIVIGGIKAYVYKVYAKEGVYYNPGKIIVIKKGNVYYQITIPFSNFSSDTPSEVPGKDIDYVTIFQQILSSFKFTN